ncbi:hypothetical protein [Clostridium sp.]|uniref:hypothetical protein n=1 Tax=Clostridium sp. TaxID=1506 RepID=UPI002604E269|nr:hypothetical protein [uncultured Clostridium sp.]
MYSFSEGKITGSTNIVLPEYYQETRRFVDGDIFNIVDSKTGKVIDKFMYDIDTDEKWIMVGGK